MTLLRMASRSMTLYELLVSKKFWRELATAFDKHRWGDWNSLDLANRIRNEPPPFVLREFFEEHVIQKLPRPHEITADELPEIAIQQLAGVPLARIANLSDEELRKANPETWIGRTRFLAFVDAAIPEDEPQGDDDQFFDLDSWDADPNSDMEDSDVRLWPHESKKCRLHLVCASVDKQPWRSGLF
jgi:hypothetical protein